MSGWDILDSYFRDHFYPFTKHHLDSYREFLKAKVPDVVKSFNPFTMIKGDLTVEVYIGGESGTEIFLDKPTIIDSEGTPILLTPQDARLKNLTYDTRIYANITIKYKEPNSVKTKEFPNTLIGAIPIMLHSEACILNKQGPVILRDLNECPYDQGGYFIIDGKEKVIIAQERNTTNRLFVEESKEPEFSHIGRIRCTSETGETSLSTRTVMFYIINPFWKGKPEVIEEREDGEEEKEENKAAIKSTKEFASHKGAIVVTIPSIYNGAKFPLFHLFRALGVESDRAIIEYIFGDVSNPDSEQLRPLLDFIRPSIVFNRNIYTQEGVLEEFKLNTRYNSDAAVKNFLTKDLFPNMGNSFTEKARFLGQQVREFVLISLGVLKSPNRDGFAYKRVDLSGFLLAELFQESYSSFRKKCRDTLDSQYLYGPWKHNGNKIEELVRTDNINKIIVPSIITNSIKRSMKGKWGTEDSTTPEEGKVQDLSRISYIGFLSHLRRANNPLDRSIKLVGPHKLNNQQWGIMCPWESPDGASVGLLKNFSIIASVTFGCDSNPIKNCLYDLGVFKLSNVLPTAVKNYTRVYLNGMLLGYHNEPHTLVKTMRLYRRNSLINCFTSVIWNISEEDIRILTEPGRCVRPLIIVEKGELTLPKQFQSKSWFDLVFGQTIKAGSEERYYNCSYTKPEEIFKGMNRENIIKQLESNASSIEYLDIEEANTVLIAMTPSDITAFHTHCEISPAAIFSVVPINIPFSNHNQSVRNVFHCSQSKQAIGIYSTTFNKRFDTMSYILHYPQRPIISTRTSYYTASNQLPYGVNAIVAIASYSGQNQEDAVIINKAAIDRGFFTITCYKSMVAEESNNGQEQVKFMNPQTLQEQGQEVKGIKHGNYNLIDKNGIISKESYIPKDHKAAVIGMVQISKEISSVKDGVFMKNEVKEVYRDMSRFTDISHYGYVDKVYNSDGVCKVRFRKVRNPELGDKTCSFHGQKGVCGAILPQEQMPFTKDGIIPDIIINPHAFPSRMTIGHLIECVFSKLCCMQGSYGDGTVFLPLDLDTVAGQLEDYGFEKHGNEIMYDGRTGAQIATEVFIGPTYYLRLKHMVADKINSRSTGTKVLRTHQPVAGRASGGGLRIGEMERDVILGYGLAQFAKESMMERSDKYRYAVCRHCGSIADWNPNRNIVLCRGCDSNDVVLIETPYAFKLLVQELEALGVNVHYSSEPILDRTPEDDEVHEQRGGATIELSENVKVKIECPKPKLDEASEDGTDSEHDSEDSESATTQHDDEKEKDEDDNQGEPATTDLPPVNEELSEQKIEGATPVEEVKNSVLLPSTEKLVPPNVIQLPQQTGTPNVIQLPSAEKPVTPNILLSSQEQIGQLKQPVNPTQLPVGQGNPPVNPNVIQLQQQAGGVVVPPNKQQIDQVISFIQALAPTEPSPPPNLSPPGYFKNSPETVSGGSDKADVKVITYTTE